MRKSQASIRGLWAAGAATALTAAAVLAAAPPVFATVASATTSTPGGGPASGQVTLTLSGALSGVTTPVTYFSTAACADTYSSTTAAANITATTTKVDDNSAKVTVPSTLSLNSGAARTYYICIYASSTAGAAGKIQGTYTLTPIGSITPANGPSGGGNTITYSAPAGSTPFASATSPYAIFVTTGCPAVYGTQTTLYAPAPKLSSSSVSIAVPTSVVGAAPTSSTAAPAATPYQICVYSDNTTSGALLASTAASGYSVTLNTISLNQTTGAGYTSPSAPVNLTISSPTGFLTGVTAPAATFDSASACPAMYPSSPGANLFTTVRKVANNKAAVTLPSAVTATATYNVCIFSAASNSTGKLLAATTYSAVTVPTISGVTPNAGSPLGGSTITVTGTNFPTTPGSITATLGGEDLTNVTPLDAGTFTATTPAHSNGAVTLTVTTNAGSVSSQSAYTYVNSISVTPSTAPNTNSAVDLDITGTGFDALSFNDTAFTGAKVYLTDGVYGGNGPVGGTARSDLDAVAACANVLVISSTELVCRLDLTSTRAADDTNRTGSGYTIPLGDAAVTQDSAILVAAAPATFTKGDIGKTVTETANPEIALGTTVLDVLDPSTIVLSKPALADGPSTAAIVIGTVAARGSVTRTSATVLTSNNFVAGDVGKVISNLAGGGTNTGGNIVITAVNTTAHTATVAGANFAGTISSVDVSASAASVPPGAYNIVVVSDSSLNAASTPGYTQSVPSSGSTFTVANY